MAASFDADDHVLEEGFAGSVGVAGSVEILGRIRLRASRYGGQALLSMTMDSFVVRERTAGKPAATKRGELGFEL